MYSSSCSATFLANCLLASWWHVLCSNVHCLSASLCYIFAKYSAFSLPDCSLRVRVLSKPYVRRVLIGYYYWGCSKVLIILTVCGYGFRSRVHVLGSVGVILILTVIDFWLYFIWIDGMNRNITTVDLLNFFENSYYSWRWILDGLLHLLGNKFINMDTNVNKGWRKQENMLRVPSTLITFCQHEMPCRDGTDY